MISACDSCGRLAPLDDAWHCDGCASTIPCPPPSVRPPALHAAALRYDGEDWDGAGRAEYELAMQEMGDADYE